MAVTPTIAPVWTRQFFTSSGIPVSNGTIKVYDAGTNDPVVVYQDSALTPHAWPVPLSVSGRVTLFLLPGAYKFEVYDSNDVLVPGEDVDNVLSVAPFNVDVDIPIVAGEDLEANESAYMSNGHGSTVAGRWYGGDASAPESSTDPVMAGMVVASALAGESTTVRISGAMDGFVGLIPGAKYYISETPGEITATEPANPRVIGQASSATVLDISASAGTSMPVNDTNLLLTIGMLS